MPETPKEFDGFAIGGHDDGISVSGGVVFKRMQEGGRGEREAKFIQMAASHAGLRDLVVKFERMEKRGDEMWVGMENLLHGMSKPAMMDVKMGTRLYGDDAKPDKIESMLKKANKSTTALLGVVISGAKLPNPTERGPDTLIGQKYKNAPVDQDSFRAAIERFFPSERLRASALEKVRRISSFFEVQTEFAFYGSSILFAYDAARGDDAEVTCKMIDFAHVWPTPGEGGRDEGYVTGIHTLIRTLSPKQENQSLITATATTMSDAEQPSGISDPPTYIASLFSRGLVSGVTFVRHSQTDKPLSNTREADLGRRLTEGGVAKAVRARRWTRAISSVLESDGGPSVVFSSQAQRCVATARLMGFREPTILSSIYEVTMEEQCRQSFEKVGYAPLAAYAEHDAPFRAAARAVLLEVASALRSAATGLGKGEKIGNVVIVGHAVHSAMCALLVARALSRDSGNGTRGDGAEGEGALLSLGEEDQGCVLMSELHGEAEAFHITENAVSMLHARDDAKVNWGDLCAANIGPTGVEGSSGNIVKSVTKPSTESGGHALVALFACVHLAIMGYRAVPAPR